MKKRRCENSKPFVTRRDKNPTSWEGVNRWYHSLVGKKGQHYHRNVILPRLVHLLNLSKGASLLDLACGNGILADEIDKEISYLGVDISPSLIKEAKKLRKGREFLVGDATKSLKLKKRFSHVVIMLALQNIEYPEKALKNCVDHMQPGGSVVIVVNHPCFRIPRQSGWGVDETKKLQYRRVDSYMSPLRIPIQAHPSKGVKSETTLSFHRSLSDYSQIFSRAGFFIEQIEEWCSDKESEGSKARMENRARNEIPLFMAFKLRLV